MPGFLAECFKLIGAGFKEDAGMTVHVILFFLEGLLAMIAAWFATVYHFYLGHGPGPAGRETTEMPSLCWPMWASALSFLL